MLSDNIQLINIFIILVILYILPSAIRAFKINIFSITSDQLLNKVVIKQRNKLEKMENELPHIELINLQFPKLLKSLFILIYIIRMSHILLILGIGISILVNFN